MPSNVVTNSLLRFVKFSCVTLNSMIKPKKKKKQKCEEEFTEVRSHTH